MLSYDRRCTNCSDSYFGWFLYLSITLIPTTVFFLVVVLCQVRTTSAPLNFFIIACQMVSVGIVAYPNDTVYHSQTGKILKALEQRSSLCGTWTFLDSLFLLSV